MESWTRTTKLATLVWPAPSVASHVTVVSPSGKSTGAPGDADGTQSPGTGPLTASAAVTSYSTRAPSALSASATSLPTGTFSAGGPSTTVAAKVPTATAPVAG